MFWFMLYILLLCKCRCLYIYKYILVYIIFIYTYMYISWDASPVRNSCERRSIWSPSKRVNNPGGECRWVGEHQHAIYNGVCCFEQSCWFWWSVLHYPSPPKKKTQLSCKTNLESVLLMSSSQFCPSHLYLAQPRCFFSGDPSGVKSSNLRPFRQAHQDRWRSWKHWWTQWLKLSSGHILPKGSKR